MKGITPVIAVILLLLITISLVGFAFIYFSRIAETASGQIEQQLEQQLEQQQKRVRVENAIMQTVTVRNVGSVNLNAGDLALFVNNQLDTGCSFSSIAPNAIATCTLTITSNCQNSTIRVTSPGNSDSIVCS